MRGDNNCRQRKKNCADAADANIFFISVLHSSIFCDRPIPTDVISHHQSLIRVIFIEPGHGGQVQTKSRKEKDDTLLYSTINKKELNKKIRSTLTQKDKY